MQTIDKIGLPYNSITYKVNINLYIEFDMLVYFMN